MSIRFKYEGPLRVGFAAIGRELGPGEEFDVPENLALNFAEHGHCTCLEPEKLEPLRAAVNAAQAVQDELRARSGLVNAHPLAPQPVPEKAAPKRAKTDPPATAVATAK